MRLSEDPPAAMTLAELLDRCAPRPSRQGDLLIAVCREIIPSVCGLPAPAPITSFKPGMSLVRPLEGLPDAPTKNRGFHTLDGLVIHPLRSPLLGTSRRPATKQRRESAYGLGGEPGGKG